VTRTRWQSEFLDSAAHLSDVSGLPPSIIRVFAWLVVCDPPHQSVDDLRAALDLSAGAISTATSALVRMGAVERLHQPGERRLYYRLRPGGTERLMRMRLEATAEMRRIVERALSHARRPHPRLSEMHDMYRWFEDALARLLEERVTRHT